MRNFITFKHNTSAYNKFMVLENISRQEAWDMAVRLYPNAVHKVLNEEEASRLAMNQQHKWIPYGTKINLYDENNKLIARYPLTLAVSLEPIVSWFKEAKPTPQPKDLTTQLGCMYEEVSESLSALNNSFSNETLTQKIREAKSKLDEVADCLKRIDSINLDKDVKIELLDAFADIVVTIAGSAYMSHMNISGALTEVNESNFSKFEDGKAIFDENGKIIKGKKYFKPQLEHFIKG